MFDQETQQCELPIRKIHKLSFTGDLPATHIHLYLAKRVNPLTRTERLASQQCFNTCHEFGRIEWLSDIVICPELQAHHLVDDLIAGGEQKYRSCQAGLPDVPTKIQAVAKRQHDIEDHQIVRDLDRFFVALLPVCGCIDHVSFTPKTNPERRPECRFVLHHENALVHRGITASAFVQDAVI